MSKRELISKEIEALYNEGASIAVAFQKSEEKSFQYDYQRWYTKALKVVTSLGPDRLAEFRGYYEADPKRKSLGYGTYVIQDFLKGVAPNSYQYENFDARRQVLTCFFNQLTIFKAINERVDSVLGDIEAELYAELQGSEVVVARRLAKVSLRAAGSLVGVVIEGHLQKVAAAHGVKLAKKNPTIADLNDPLRRRPWLTCLRGGRFHSLPTYATFALTRKTQIRQRSRLESLSTALSGLLRMSSSSWHLTATRFSTLPLSLAWLAVRQTSRIVQPGVPAHRRRGACRAFACRASTHIGGPGRRRGRRRCRA